MVTCSGCTPVRSKDVHLTAWLGLKNSVLSEKKKGRKKKNQNELSNAIIFTKFKNTCIQIRNTPYASVHILSKRCSLCPLEWLLG